VAGKKKRKKSRWMAHYEQLRQKYLAARDAGDVAGMMEALESISSLGAIAELEEFYEDGDDDGMD